MNLDAWQKNWDALGKDDPLWVVLTDPSKKGGRWKPEDFFAAGAREINEVLGEVAKLDRALTRHRALDFGCGVGRLSQALAEQFDEVHGVDISPSMIDHARRFDRHPDKCTYHLNAENHLRLFPDNWFDFVYSNITLQHIEPRFAKNYIAEFIRVIRPGGIVAFQVITPAFWRRLVPDFLSQTWRKLKFKGQPFIGMFGIPDADVAALLAGSGATVLRVDRTPHDTRRWLSRRSL